MWHDWGAGGPDAQLLSIYLHTYRLRVKRNTHHHTHIMVSSSTHCRRFAIIAAFFIAAWNVHVGLNNQLLFYSTSSSSWGGKDVDDMPPAAQQQQQQQQQWTAYYTSKKNDTPVEERARNDNNRQRQRPIHNSNQASTAPLFYHVSPGSTGSRSLYFAT